MTALLTALALIAFAANSLLCRLALGEHVIDPVSFTAIRLGSGALILAPLTALLREPGTQRRIGGSWVSAMALFVYAAAFSVAYVSLTAGIGALILFGSVQMTMLCVAARTGDGLRATQWCGFVAAIGGLVVLVWPGLSAPDPMGASMMATAGVAWGVYSLRGRGVAGPVRMTAGNFARSVPFVLAVLLPAAGSLHAQSRGVGLALASGTMTSGLGYVIWYRALRGLRMSQAAVLQLLVPVLATLGGVALLGEHLSPRLVTASLLILGGVALAATQRASAAR